MPGPREVGDDTNRCVTLGCIPHITRRFLRAPWKGADLQRVQLPPGNSVAPAGSNRSGGGGNETAGAFDSASRQAVTRVNAEQASKRITWEPTRRINGEGRRHWGTGGHTPRSDANQWSHRGSGDGMPAQEIRRNTGNPRRWGAWPHREP